MMKALKPFLGLFCGLFLLSAIPGQGVCAAEYESDLSENSIEETVDMDEEYGDDTSGADVSSADSADPDSAEADESASSVFATYDGAISLGLPIFTDPETGLTYTLTTSGTTVSVDYNSYWNALSSGDTEAILAILNAQTSSFYWDGSCLTLSAGINYGPSGKETYYNLDMTPVITTLRENGYDGIYWVRDDGVKMYGVYILLAASSSSYEYGALVETSLGTGMIADFGCGPGIIDIATNW